MKKKEKNFPEVRNVNGQPQEAFDLINKYGTYNIQPTADAENEFPFIAQGLGKKK